jgi:hypothetical protein
VVLIVLAVSLTSLGFYRGWLTVSAGREAQSDKVDVNLTVHSQKVREETEAVKEEATEFARKTADAATDLGQAARDGVKRKPE